MAEGRVAQDAVEVLSDSAALANSRSVAQQAVEVLSDSTHIVNQSFVAQQAVEVLSSVYVIHLYAAILRCRC